MEKSRVEKVAGINVARKRTFKSRGYLMTRKRQKPKKTVLNVAKVPRKNSRHLVPATFSTIKVYNFHAELVKIMDILPKKAKLRIWH